MKYGWDERMKDGVRGDEEVLVDGKWNKATKIDKATYKR